jgi:hypothetical protein
MLYIVSSYKSGEEEDKDHGSKSNDDDESEEKEEKVPVHALQNKPVHKTFSPQDSAEQQQAHTAGCVQNISLKSTLQ